MKQHVFTLLLLTSSLFTMTSSRQGSLLGQARKKVQVLFNNRTDRRLTGKIAWDFNSIVEKASKHCFPYTENVDIHPHSSVSFNCTLSRAQGVLRLLVHSKKKPDTFKQSFFSGAIQRNGKGCAELTVTITEDE